MIKGVGRGWKGYKLDGCKDGKKDCKEGKENNFECKGKKAGRKKVVNNEMSSK